MKLGSELDGCTCDGCCSVDVVDGVVEVRRVVVLWDGFRCAYYLSVVCLEPFPCFTAGYTFIAFSHSCIHLLLYRIHAYLYSLLAYRILWFAWSLLSGVIVFRFVVIRCCCAVACACILIFLG